MRGHHDIGQTEERVLGRRFLREHVEGRARDMAGSRSVRASAASSDQPAPRAQLMIRTPFLVLARFSADRIFAVFSGIGDVQT